MIYRILISIPVFLAFFLILLRLGGLKEITLGNRKVVLFRVSVTGGETVTKKDILQVIGWAVFIRLLLYILSAYMLPFFEIGTIDELFTKWANWDGSHYLNLAKLGYFDFTEDGEHLFLVFYPLYPWLIRALHLLIPNYLACAYIVANLCFIGGCCFFYAMIAGEFSKETAFRSVILLSLFPFAFFFGAVRTESLFFLTSAASLYYIRKHKFFTASVWGALAALSRMQGLLLAFAAAAEIVSYYHPFRMLGQKRFRDFWDLFLHKAMCVPVMALGTISYLILNYAVSGNPFQFLIYEKEHWYQGYAYFATAIETMYNQMISAELSTAYLLWLPQIVVFFFSLAVLLYGIHRMPVTYSVYFFVYLLMNFSISWPLSCGRYMTTALPMFLVLGEGSKRHPLIYKMLVITFAALLVSYLAPFLKNMHLY